MAVLVLEELIRSIAEGQPEDQSDTVLAMLQARIGRLGPGPRRVVRAAAVFGQTFWRGGVAALLGSSPQSAELSAWLGELVAAELAQAHAQSRIAEQAEYTFRHALVRDAAYALLAPDDLCIGHRLAAEFLLSTGEQEPGAIGEHFARGDEHARAAVFFLQAGESATRLSAYTEARKQLAAALRSLETLPETDEVKQQRADTLLKQVRAAHISDQPKQNLRRLDEAAALLTAISSTESDFALRLAWVNYWRGRLHYYCDESHESLRFHEQVAAIARQHEHKELYVLASAACGTAQFALGRADLGLPLLEPTIETFAAMGHSYEWVRAVGHRGLCRIGLGQVETGFADLDRAHARALEIDQPIIIAMTHLYYCLASMHTGDFQAMLSRATRSLELATSCGEKLYLAFSFGFCAWAENQLGRPEDALRSHARLVEIHEEMGGRLLYALLLDAMYAEILLACGRVTEALDRARTAAADAQRAENCNALGIAERVLAQCLHRSGAPAAEVDAHFAASIAAYTLGGLVLDIARTRAAFEALRKTREADVEQRAAQGSG